MNDEVTRRRLLLAGAALLLGFMGRSEAFEREQAATRYRNWLQQFKKDLQALGSAVPQGEPVTAEHVERWCGRSVVPGSRAVQNFSKWLTDAHLHGERHVGGEIVSVGMLTIVMRLLEASIPAGHGGRFPEPEGSRYADKSLSVWYVHIQAGSWLEDYFADGSKFKPYHLPKPGVLERNAYPFLLFEEQDASLRFGGISGEWLGAAERAYTQQFS